MKFSWLAAFPVCFGFACSTPGAEGQPCYGNGTCDDGLTCASNLCVLLAEGEGDVVGEGEGEGEGGGGGGEGEGEAPCIGVIEGDVILASSLDVEAVAGVCTITGSLTISGRDLTTVALLAGLQRVDGDLTVTGTQSLVALVGLDDLAELGGDLVVVRTSALESLSALSALTAVHDLIVSENTSLTTVGLSSVASVDGTLVIGRTTFSNEALAGNPSLVSLGLPALTAVASTIDIRDNDALSSLAGLEGLTSTQGTLQIADNDTLLSLAGLDVSHVGGDLNIFSNDSLSSLVGLDELTAIDGQFGLQAIALTSLTGIQALRTVGGTFGMGAVPIQDLRGLEGLQHVGGDLNLAEMPNLSTLEGLGGLQSLGGLYLGGLPALRSLEGIDGVESLNSIILQQLPALTSVESLSSVSGELQILGIDNCDQIASLAGLEGFTYPPSTPPLATVAITGNPALRTLVGLNLGSFVGDFNIINNDALTDLHGAEGAVLFNRLDVRGNASLVSLAGLEDLVRVDQNFSISDNSALTSLAPLAALESIGEPGVDLGIAVARNCALPQEDVDTFRARLGNPTCTCVNNGGGCG